jgi:hypothetical protein
MRIAVLVAAALSVAACAGDPVVRIETVEVVRETQRPCPVVAPVRPDALPVATLPRDARDAVRVVYARLLEWAGAGGYGDQADATIRLCADP